MRKLILFISVILILTAGWIFYLHQEKKDFIDTLPTNNSSASVSSVSSANATEDSNNFVKVAMDGETQASPDDRVEPLPQEQNASAEKTFSEKTPDEKADFVHGQWIQMFGDIPQVHAASEYMRKVYKQERMTIDDKIAGTEASHYLFPDGGHGMVLEMLKTHKARGGKILYEEDLGELRPAENAKRVVIGKVPPHLREKNAQMGDIPASHSIASGGMSEDTVSPAARSELPVTSEHFHQAGGHLHAHETPPAPTAAKSVEAGGWEGLSSEQRENVKQLFDQYGTEEGLRRFREMDPDAARRFERRHPPVSPRRQGEDSGRDVPSGHTHPDGQSHNDAP